MSRDIRFAIIIGSNQYNERKLKYSVKDAEDIKTLLLTKCNFNEENIALVRFPIDFDKGHREVIEKKFSDLSSRIQKNSDTLLFFFSGHGIYEESEEKSYLELSETTRISIQEIWSMIKKLNVKNNYLIVDACNSGGELDLSNSKINKIGRSLSYHSKGIYCILGSTSKGLAYEPTELETKKYGIENGFLTHSIIEVINDPTKYTDGYMSIRIIDDYVSLKTQLNTKFSQITVSNIEVIGYHPFAFHDTTSQENKSLDPSHNLLFESYKEQIKAKDDLISELKSSKEDAQEKIKALIQEKSNNLNESEISGSKEFFDFLAKDDLQSALNVLPTKKLKSQFEQATLSSKKIDEKKNEIDQIKFSIKNITQLKAFIQVELGMTDEALASFEYAISIDPDNYDFQLSYATYLHQLGKSKKSIIVLNYVIEESDNIQLKTDALIKLGRIYYEYDMYEESVSAYNIAKTLYQNTDEEHFNLEDLYLLDVKLGIVHGEHKEYAKAISILSIAESNFQQLFESNQSEIVDYLIICKNNLALVYENTNLNEESEKKYLEAISLCELQFQIDPESYSILDSIYQNIGKLYRKMKVKNNALHYLNEAKNVREKLAEDFPDEYLPKLANTLNSLGLAHKNSDNISISLNYFERALKIRREFALKYPNKFDLDVVMTIINLGQFYLDLYRLSLDKQYKTVGINYIQEGLTILKSYSNGLKAKEYQTVLEHILSAFNDINEENISLIKEARNLEKLGDSSTNMKERYYSQAIVKYEKLLLKNRSIVNLSRLSYCYIKLNRQTKLLDKLIPVQQKIIFLREEIYDKIEDKKEIKHALAIDYGNMARYLLFRNQFDESLKYGAKVLSLDPKEEWIYTDIVRAYILTDRFEDAKNIYLSLKNKQYPHGGTTFKEEFLSSLEDLEETGIYHPDFEKAREILNTT